MLILLINLARRPDRLEFMRSQLDALGLACERIEAIDGEGQTGGPLTPSFTGAERACAMSHRSAWQRFLATGEDHCLILEDDVILAPALPTFLGGFRGIPEGGDILRLETQLVRTRMAPPRAGTLDGFATHRVYSVHTGCGAYILSRDFATRAVRDLTDFDAPLDYILFDPQWPSFYPNTFHQLRPALCIQTNLHAPTRDATIGASDLQPFREMRFRLNPKPQRSFLVKCGREVGRWLRRTRAFARRMAEFPTRPSFWYEVPFAGTILPAAMAILDQKEAAGETVTRPTERSC